MINMRKGNNRPFRARKKWDGFEDKPEYFYVKKLANFFTRHDNIDMNEFFEAPFKIYPENEYYDIKFFTSLKAIKIYKIHKNKLNNK